MRIKFVDIAQCLNVHAFIIWEFIRRYGFEKGVKRIDGGVAAYRPGNAENGSIGWQLI